MSVESGLSAGDGGEEKPDSGRLLSWEEYRAQYVMRQRLRYQMQREASDNMENSTPPAPPATAARAAPPQEEWQQRREQAQHPAEEQRSEGALANVWSRIELRPGDFINAARVMGRVILAAFLVFRTVSLYYVFLTLMTYLGWLAVRFAFASIRIERENVAGARGASHATAARGRRSHLPHQHHRISLPRKTLYIITRCITSFLLSFSPTYSVEQLEAELLEDGIIGPHPHQD
ncbi:hypothetical protein TcYC6_0034840 [Trypanosoma cruzi]|nr:hypothetical protein TcYC6_0034840 [Trypanosoma cruzi]